MANEYVPLKDQCWFKGCQKRACKYTKVNGTIRYLCEKHGRQYSNSAEGKHDKN